jgi:hypothetical protein
MIQFFPLHRNSHKFLLNQVTSKETVCSKEEKKISIPGCGKQGFGYFHLIKFYTRVVFMILKNEHAKA